MNSEIIGPETLNLLAQFDTPTVCNVIELFNNRPRTEGYMNASIVSCFPEMPPMVGFAATATFKGSTPKEDLSYGGIEKQVDSFSLLQGPAIVVFEDLDQPTVSATFGEIMCTSYQKFGASGLITSGAGRDLDQVRALGFPVFTNGTICSHGYSRFPSIGEEITVGGIKVKPGDLLHGDCNGVTTIPKSIAGKVAALCKPYMEAEGIILKYLNSQQVTVQGLAQAQQECKEYLKKLASSIDDRS
ncbi:MAG: demethylmenaquinone methyltransferase [Cyclobacteriaceae bacterium]|nr:MAG: demethylmenaquinone methyltransferase [Cyclobacteriaceae bacterium]